MKYRLINEFGNRIVNTDNEIKKNRLLEKGFKIDLKEEKPKRRKKVEDGNQVNPEGHLQ